MMTSKVHKHPRRKAAKDGENLDRIVAQAKAEDKELKHMAEGVFVGPEDIEAVATKVRSSFQKGGWSPKMIAIVGYVLDQAWTSPQIDDIVVTSDGYVLAETEHEVGDNEFLGSVSDLERNWEMVLDASDLSFDERSTAENLFHVKVLDHRT